MYKYDNIVITSIRDTIIITFISYQHNHAHFPVYYYCVYFVLAIKYNKHNIRVLADGCAVHYWRLS